MDTNKIGKFIAELRRELGYTQEELGKRLNVTDKAISKWERGLSFPDISIINRLVVELKISISELLNGERFLLLSSNLTSAERQNRITGELFSNGKIRLDYNTQNDSIVSPYLFGNNLEHSRSDISGGISAQMLRNRKFVGKPGPMNGTAMEWFPIGQATYCSFTKGYTHHIKEKYHMRRSMEHNSQFIRNFAEGEVAGFGQHGLFIRKEKTYEFAAVVKSDTALDLTAQLCDRSGKTVFAKTVLPVAKNTGEWVRYTALLSPAASSEDADLRITFTADAAVTFGAVSLLPTDHFHGMRRDVIAQMKEMGIKVLRWPGGNFAGEYSWFDGLLPVDERSPFESYMHFETQPHTGGYDFHEINTDDFIALCREIGAEPFLTLNLTWNTAEENAAWVEYCNGDETTEYGKLRAERGHPEPYSVMLWSLGNEFGYGHMEGDNTPSGYTFLAMESGKKMLEVCPNLTFCAAGPYPHPQWAQYSARPLKSLVPLVSLHDYAQSFPTWSKDADLREEYEACLSGVENARGKIREVRAQIDPMQKISFDEWNLWYAWFRPSGVLEGIFTALMLHMIIGEAPKSGIDLAAQFEAVNESAIRVLPDRAFLTATGQAFSIIKHHINGFLYHASDCAVATGNSGVVTATLVNPQFEGEKVFDLPETGDRVDAVLYLGETVYPGSLFRRVPLAVKRENGRLIVSVPAHSIALIRCIGREE